MLLESVSQDRVDRSGLGTPGWTRVTEALKPSHTKSYRADDRKLRASASPGWMITVQGFGGAPEARSKCPDLAGRSHAHPTPPPPAFFPLWPHCGHMGS